MKCCRMCSYDSMVSALGTYAYQRTKYFMKSPYLMSRTMRSIGCLSLYAAGIFERLRLLDGDVGISGEEVVGDSECAWRGCGKGLDVGIVGAGDTRAMGDALGAPS